MNYALLLLAAALAGAVLPIQAACNAKMGTHLQQPMQATVYSFLIGLVALLLIALAMRQPAPAPAKLLGAPWWAHVAGMLGAVYVVSSIILTPKLGVVALTGAVLAGQMVIAVILDHFGWLGLRQNPVTPLKGLGIAFLIAGVLLIRGSAAPAPTDTPATVR
ncbi:MAG: DMT family transporter [Phycisphaerales bacterium]|nr:DMT family transporter [Phycisphaerales bacterium]